MVCSGSNIARRFLANSNDSYLYREGNRGHYVENISCPLSDSPDKDKERRKKKRAICPQLCGFLSVDVLGTTHACACSWTDCAQVREQRSWSRKDKTEHTFESRLFRSRMGLCRKTICLVATLPSLHQKKEKKHSKSSEVNW